VRIFELSEDGVWARHDRGWSLRLCYVLGYEGPVQCMVPARESQAQVLERQTGCRIECITDRTPYAHVWVQGDTEGMHALDGLLEGMVPDASRMVAKDPQVQMGLTNLQLLIDKLYCLLLTDWVPSSAVRGGAAVGPPRGMTAARIGTAMQSLLPILHGYPAIRIGRLAAGFTIDKVVMFPAASKRSPEVDDEQARATWAWAQPFSRKLVAHFDYDPWKDYLEGPTTPMAACEFYVECFPTDGSSRVPAAPVFVEVDTNTALDILCRVSSMLNTVRILLLKMAFRRGPGAGSLSRLPVDTLPHILSFFVYVHPETVPSRAAPQR